MRKVIMKVCLVAAVLAGIVFGAVHFSGVNADDDGTKRMEQQQEKRTEEPNSSGTTAVQKQNDDDYDDRDDIDDADDRYDDDRYETDDNDDWDDDRYDNDDNDDVYDDDRYEKDDDDDDDRKAAAGKKTTRAVYDDDWDDDDRYEKDPPLGCISVDGKLYVHNGVRILGLGGSMRYKDGVNQYTDRQMAWRVWKLKPRLFRKKGFDILLTHAPGQDMVDCHDLAHMGFSTFNRLLDKYHPALFLHGHTHLNYGRSIPRESTYGSTRVVNAYERYILEL